MLTLQEQCLDIIINNFDRFHSAYVATEDLHEKLKYEFLRRKFSFEIAEKLHELFELREDYLDFVLNNHLKSLDTSWLQSFSWEVISKKLIEIGPSLEKIYFNYSGKQWDKIVCHLPNLLYASFSECNDSHIKMIAEHCPKIRSIDCASSAFSKEGLKPICCKENGEYPCSDLKEIKIGASNSYPDRVTDESIGCLIKGLPFLENLEYQNLPLVLYDIHKDDINIDKIKPYNLITLQLINIFSFENFDETLKICVSLCPNLRKFSCPVENENHLKLCSQLTKLEELHLRNAQETPIDLNEFLRLRGSSLTSLKIDNFSLLISSMFKTCSKLTRLHMDKITFQKEETDAKTTLPKLKDLTFKNLILIDAVTDKVVTSILSSSPNLELLSFKACELYSSDIKAAIMKSCELNKLQIISFKSSVVDAKFVQDVLVTCSSLSTLNLEHSVLSNGDDDIGDRLESIAETLPNQPLVLYYDGHNSDFSDYENFAYEYHDYFNSDEEDDDYNDYSDYDYDYDPDEDY